MGWELEYNTDEIADWNILSFLYKILVFIWT